MVRRNTWILLFILAVLVGFSFYLGNIKAKKAAGAAPTSSGNMSLFSATDGSPTGIKIVDSLGVSVEVERDATGAWVVKAPTQAAADQGSSEAASTQVGALRVLSTVQLAADIVGLDKPANTLTITFSPAKVHKLVIGSVTPIQDGYYAQLDGGQINVVDKGGIDALLAMLTSPPYLATLTPIATLTPSPGGSTLTPEATLAPVGSPSGTPATASP